MKKSIIQFLGITSFLWIVACGNKTENTASESTPTEAPESMVETGSYDPTRGEGQYDESNVVLGALDAGLAAKGKAIAETKCVSCHKLSDEKLVGPGWKGVTDRKAPYWIMNFITNPDPMIDKDPEVQAQLELCLVRMPNQNLTEEEARSILEFMRQNDGVK